MTTIRNAAPMVIHQGVVEDNSRRAAVVEVKTLPQHLPLYYIFAPRAGIRAMVSNDAELVFGGAAFAPRGKYYNHTTLFLEHNLGVPNMCMVESLVPDDSGAKANLRLFIDVLPTDVPRYTRDSDGSYATDASGNKVQNGTCQGYKVKWVVGHNTGNTGEENIGEATIRNGSMTAGATVSRLYPVMDLEVGYYGEDGLNTGIRLSAPSLSAMTNPDLLTVGRFYPFQFSLMRRASANESPTAVRTVFAQTSVPVSFKENAHDPVTNYVADFNVQLSKQYSNVTDQGLPLVIPEINVAHLYRDNIELLLADFHAAEVPFITEQSDFTSSVDDMHMFNLLTGRSSDGAPYESFVVDQNGMMFDSQVDMMFAGASDGTLNNVMYEKKMLEAISRYDDLNDPLQDIPTDPCTIFYDTGFTVETKLRLNSFRRFRRDHKVVAGTFVAGDRKQAPDVAYSIGVALRNRFLLAPESAEFGIPAVRAEIYPGSGIVRNAIYTKRVPFTFEMMMKYAFYQGSGDGRWKREYRFAGWPGNRVNYMTDVDTSFLPPAVRNDYWSAGLNFTQFIDHVQAHIPTNKTVYTDDTSVLNAGNLSMAICTLTRHLDFVVRSVQGIDSMTDAEFRDEVDTRFAKRIRGIFDDMYTIKAEAVITTLDEQRGYSFELPVKIYAGNMKTVGVTKLLAYRKSDLQGA